MLPVLLTIAGLASAADKPNVVVVVWDAARPANMGVYGYERETTPNIDAWAAKSAVFTNAQSTSTWNIPAMAGVLTGLFSHNHKVDYEADGFTLNLRDDVQTFAEALQGSGYATALYSAQGGYVRRPGFDQGFDTKAHVTQADVLDKGLAFVDAAGDKPFFTVLHWMDPHPPYEPAEQWDQWSDPGAPDVKLGQRDEPGWHKPYRVNTGKDKLSDVEWKRLVAQYDGEILSNDYTFGRLLDGLKDRGKRDNTIIVLTGSHGEALGEHPDQLVWHDFPYDSVLDVPLIVGGPGVPAARVDDSVRNIDIYPTVAELVGITPQHALNGQSLIPLANGKKEATPRPNIGTSHFLGAPIFWRGQRFKHFAFRKDDPAHRLFNWVDDPGEQTNLAADESTLELVIKARDAYVAESIVNP